MLCCCIGLITLPATNPFLYAGFILSLWLSGSFFFLLIKIRFIPAFFSPNVLAFAFLGLSLTIGCFVVETNIGNLLLDFNDDLKNMRFFTFSVIFCLTALSSNVVIAVRSNRALASNEVFTIKKHFSFFSFYSIFALIFLIGNFNFPFRYGLQFFLSMALVMSMSNINTAKRLFFYTLIIFIMIITSELNKREVLMLFLSIAAWDICFYKDKKELNYFSIIILVITAITLFSLIIIMSILRGYGAYEVGGVFDAVYFIPVYLKSTNFLINISDNLELGSTIASMLLPIEYIIAGKLDLLAGTTIIKPLMLPFPSDIFTFKPESALRIYTEYQAKWKYDLGGSFPVPFISEMFMNFHIFGIFIYMLVFIFFEKLFYKSIFSRSAFYKLSGFSISFLTFLLTRGSGLDLFFISIAIPLILLALIPLNKKKYINEKY